MSDAECTHYQFPISHYSEKTRWNLDAKGLSFAVRNLVPGAHFFFARQMAGIRTVPVLVDRGVAVGDSVAIARYLERNYPRPALVPSGEGRSRVLELEAYFDRPGQAVRQWLYGQAMAVRRGGAVQAMFMAYPLPARLFGKATARVIEGYLRRKYRTVPEAMEGARQTILDGLDRIERATNGDPSRYLVGGALTLADITAASLYAPLVAPAGTHWQEILHSGRMPQAVHDLRASLAGRPGWAWVVERYARDRRAPARAAA
jgi:glutathione S-transferase